MKRGVTFLMNAALLTYASTASAQILYQTDFELPITTGNLVGQDGWVNHSGSGSFIQVIPGQSAGLVNGLGSREDASIDLGVTMIAGDVFYYSYDVVVGGTADATPQYFTHFKDIGTGFNARTFVTTPNTVNGNFTFAIGETSSSTPAASFGTNFNYGQTYHLSGSYNFDTGISTLTVDGGATIDSTSQADPGEDISAFAFRQSGGNASIIIDNLVVSSAPILYQTGFEEPITTGNLVGQDGWVNWSGSGSFIQVIPGQAAELVFGSGSREDASVPLGETMAAGDVFSYSFDVIVNGTADATTTYFTHFRDGGSGINARVFVTAPNTATNNFTFAIGETSSSTPAASFATDFNYGQSYNLSGRYDFDSGISTLSVDGGTAIDSTSQADPGEDISTFAFRQSGGNTSVVIDNLVVSECTADDGLKLTLQDDTELNAQTFAVCDTIEVGPNYQIAGPDGNVTLTAGHSVVFLNGASVGIDGALSVRIMQR